MGTRGWESVAQAVELRRSSAELPVPTLPLTHPRKVDMVVKFTPPVPSTEQK